MKIKNYILFSIVLILLFTNGFTLEQVLDLKKSNQKYITQVNSFKNQDQEFKVIVDSLGKTIITQNQVLISKNREVNKLLKENSELNKINSQIKYNFNTQITDVITEYKKDSIFIYDTTYIPIGVIFDTPFGLNQEWYSLFGSIKKEGVLIDNIFIKNELIVNLGYKRERFYKSLTPQLEIINKNPYIETVSLDNLTIKENKKWYQNSLLYTIPGFILGVLVTK